MIKNTHTIITFIMLNLISAICMADDGRDFFLVQTARLGDAGLFTGILRQDFFKEKEGNAFEFEPLISWNAYDWLSLEMNANSAKEVDDSYKAEALVTGFRLRITPKNDSLMLGVATRYKLAVDSDVENALSFTFLTSYQMKKWLIGANLGVEKTVGFERETEYSIGLKHEFNHHFSLAFEVARSLEKNNEGEAVLGAFVEISDTFQVNVGLGRGVNSDVDYTLKTAVVFAF